MAKAKKKIGVIDFVVLGVLVVCLVLAIVGLSVDNWTTTEEAFGKTMDAPFADYLDMNKEMQESIDEFKDAGGDTDDAIEFVDGMLEEMGLGTLTELRLMVAFALITIIVLALLVVAYLLKMFLGLGFLRFVTLILGAVALIGGVVAIAVTAAFCGEFLLVGAGAALLAVGGMRRRRGAACGRRYARRYCGRGVILPLQEIT